MRDCHPRPRTEDVARRKLLPETPVSFRHDPCPLPGPRRHSPSRRTQKDRRVSARSTQKGASCWVTGTRVRASTPWSASWMRTTSLASLDRLSVTPDIEPERQPPTGGRGRDSSSSHSDSLAGHRFRGPDTTPPPIAAGGTTRGCEAIVHAKNTMTRDDASGPWTWSAPTTGSTGPASCVRSDECPV